MMFHFLQRFRLGARVLLLASGWLMGCGPVLRAADYFLTIGGGYSPTGNQASLEANVVFFQQILDEKHRQSRSHDIYFADGHDAAADLQVLATKKPQQTKLPATEVLASLHRRRGAEQVEYRNHRVPNVAGPLDPALIRASLEKIAKTARTGDRLIVYVTAHGSPGGKDDSYNTTIDCWNDKKITAREFTKWLNELPSGVPVLMVMAQCYCGGFAHTIFDNLDESKGLAPQLRAGFFAQQHNLMAAGCRPDIDNDDEFSSYFWGAIVGRSRTGVPVDGADIDKNGVISFAEAYAHAVTASRTIDIPLRTSDILLRTYSRMAKDLTSPAAGSDAKAVADKDSEPDAKPTSPATPDETRPQPNLSSLTGPLQSFVDRGCPVAGRIVTALGKELGFAMADDVAAVVTAYDEHRRNGRAPGRGNRRRNGSGHRELLQEITEKWPELGEARKWEDSPLLRSDNQEQLLAELNVLPSWKTYDQRRRQVEETGDQAERHELREVKFRRLINTLEVIVLDNNLPLVATSEVVERYRQMIALEESTLGALESKTQISAGHAQDNNSPSNTPVKSAPGAERARAANPDARSHEGVWKPIAAVLGGVRLPDDAVKSITLKVTDGIYEVTTEGGKESDKGTCMFDATTNPKRMTIKGTDGPNRGKTFLAIYEMKDAVSMRVCYDLSGKEFPKEFKAPKGTQLYLVGYRRQPDQHAETPSPK